MVGRRSKSNKILVKGWWTAGQLIENTQIVDDDEVSKVGEVG